MKTKLLIVLFLILIMTCAFSARIDLIKKFDSGMPTALNQQCNDPTYLTFGYFKTSTPCFNSTSNVINNGNMEKIYGFAYRYKNDFTASLGYSDPYYNNSNVLTQAVLGGDFLYRNQTATGGWTEEEGWRVDDTELVRTVFIADSYFNTYKLLETELGDNNYFLDIATANPYDSTLELKANTIGNLSEIATIDGTNYRDLNNTTQTFDANILTKTPTLNEENYNNDYYVDINSNLKITYYDDIASSNTQLWNCDTNTNTTSARDVNAKYANPLNKKEGVASLQVDYNVLKDATDRTTLIYTFASPQNLTTQATVTNGKLSYWIYIVDSTEWTDMQIRVRTDGSNYYSCTSTDSVCNKGDLSLNNGWNLLSLDLNKFSKTGSPNWTNITDLDFEGHYTSSMTSAYFLLDDVRVFIADSFDVSVLSSVGTYTIAKNTSFLNDLAWKTITIPLGYNNVYLTNKTTPTFKIDKNGLKIASIEWDFDRNQLWIDSLNLAAKYLDERFVGGTNLNADAARAYDCKVIYDWNTSNGDALSCYNNVNASIKSRLTEGINSEYNHYIAIEGVARTGYDAYYNNTILNFYLTRLYQESSDVDINNLIYDALNFQSYLLLPQLDNNYYLGGGFGTRISKTLLYGFGGSEFYPFFVFDTVNPIAKRIAYSSQNDFINDLNLLSSEINSSYRMLWLYDVFHDIVAPTSLLPNEKTDKYLKEFPINKIVVAKTSDYVAFISDGNATPSGGNIATIYNLDTNKFMISSKITSLDTLRNNYGFVRLGTSGSKFSNNWDTNGTYSIISAIYPFAVNYSGIFSDPDQHIGAVEYNINYVFHNTFIEVSIDTNSPVTLNSYPLSNGTFTATTQDISINPILRGHNFTYVFNGTGDLNYSNESLTGSYGAINTVGIQGTSFDFNYWIITAPNVGQTLVDGFTTFGNYFSGTGRVYAPITGIDFDIATCEYTVDAGLNWLAADWNSDANICQKTNYGPVVNGTIYDFNMRITSIDLNIFTGTGVQYIGDTIGPSVGATTAGTGFIINGAWIGGTGIILGGLASDGSSGIDTTTCEYTLDNGGNWLTGTWNTDHCEKTAYTILDATSYTFNTRVKDNVANQGTGNPTSTYTGDALPPITSISGCTAGWHNSAQTISFAVTDTGSGTVATQYRLNGGAWNNYGAPFVLPGDSNYQIDYNSRDPVGNIETTKTSYCAIDTTAPTVGPVFNVLQWFSSIFNVIVSNVDYLVSGKMWAKVSIDGGTFTDTTQDTLYTLDQNSGLELTLAYGKIGLSAGGYDLRMAQSFIPTTDRVDIIKIKTTIPAGSPVGPVLVQIITDNAGAPTGTILLTKTISMPNNTVITIDIPTTLIIGNTYWIVFSDALGVAENVGGIYAINGASTAYASGVRATYTSSTGAWTNAAGDLYFETWRSDYNEKVPITTDGNHLINIWIKDNAGNDTNITTFAALDATGPTTNIVSACSTGWNTSAQSFTLICADATSGCNGTRYRLNGGAWVVYSGVVNLPGDSNYQIDYNSVDLAGANETPKTAYCAVDTTAPTVDVTTTSGFTIVGTQIWGTGTIVGGTAADVTSGIDTSTCEYTINDGVSWNAATWNTNHCEKVGIPIAASTIYKFNTRVRNNAGILGTGTATVWYTADNVAPTVGVTTITGFTTYTTFFKGSGTILGGAAADIPNVSGINTSSCYYTSNNGTNWLGAVWLINHCERSFVGINGWTYYFNTRVSDAAGNLGTGTVTSGYTYDSNGPQTDLNNTARVIDTNIGLKCRDANSGCKYIWYNLDNYGWQRTVAPSVDFNWFIIPTTGMHALSYLSTDNLDTNGTQYDANVGVAGKLHLRVADENTRLFLGGVSVLFNGTTYLIDGNNVNGSGDINLVGLTSGIKEISFSKTGYGTRTYQIDMNAYYDYNVNMLLLSTLKQVVWEFQFYMNDGNTIAANGWGELYRPDLNNYSIGRYVTSATGRAVFSVNIYDQNYIEKITSSAGDINLAYLVKLTVFKPKDEITGSVIDGNWNLLGPTQNTIFTNLTGDINLYILPNLFNSFSMLIVDSNALDPAAGTLYFPRSYTEKYTGYDITDTLQPYLISIVDGDLIKFIVQNELGIAVPNITITISKMILGTKTMVTSGISDSSGEFSAPLAVANTYLFDLYANGKLISPYENFYLQINEDRYYFTISVGYDVNAYNTRPVTIVWNPGTEYLYSQNVLYQTITSEDVDYVRVNIVQYMTADMNVKTVRGTYFFDCSGTCVISENLAGLVNPDRNHPIYVDVNLYRDGNFAFYKTSKRYKMQITGTTDLLQLLFNARRSFGCAVTDSNGNALSPLDYNYPCAWTTIAALLISIMSIGGFVYALRIINPYAMGIVGALVLVVFTLGGWFYWPLLFILGILLVLGLYGRRGSE